MHSADEQTVADGCGRIFHHLNQRAHRSLVLSIAFIIVCQTSARSEKMLDVLRVAFDHSPVLKAERERLRSTAQSVPAAQAGFLPTVTASADAGWQEAQYASATGVTSRRKPMGWSATVEQPIFDGGAALNAVRRANASVRAGRQTVASVESDVLLAAASAYADVIQARAVLALQIQSMRAFQTTRNLTKERRSVGDVAIADVAQTEAALAGAEIQVGTARVALTVAEAQFLQIVGRHPKRLEAFHTAALALPEKLENALHQAETQHPQIFAAYHREEAARHNIEVARAKYLPTVSLQASYQSRRDADGTVALVDPRSAATVQAVAHIPLYSGGSVDAEVNAARHTRLSLVHELAQERAVVRTAVTQAWSNWYQTVLSRKLLANQIEANSRALAGLRKEQSVGQRAVIDVLNAERDLVTSRIAMEQARRATTVSGFTLLASVGALSMQTLISASAPRVASQRLTIEATKQNVGGTAGTSAAWSTTVHADGLVSKTIDRTSPIYGVSPPKGSSP